MFVNDEEVGAHKTHGTEQEVTTDWDRRTFFGRALTNMKNERYCIDVYGPHLTGQRSDEG